MQVNLDKIKVLHVRNHQRPRRNYKFHIGNAPVGYTDSYKYLGYILHEHLIESKNVETLTAAASRSFGRTHSIFKSVGNLGIHTYETLYESYIDPILNYASGVWGFSDFTPPKVLHNRIMRFYLGVHKFAPVTATKLEMDWLESAINDGLICLGCTIEFLIWMRIDCQKLCITGTQVWGLTLGMQKLNTLHRHLVLTHH